VNKEEFMNMGTPSQLDKTNSYRDANTQEKVYQTNKYNASELPANKPPPNYTSN
jgi:hypothetical protein